MTQKTYSKTESSLKTERAKSSPMTAIFIALTIYISGTALIGGFFRAFYLLFFFLKGEQIEEIIQLLLASLSSVSLLSISLFILEYIVSLISGFMCAKLSKTTSYIPVFAYMAIIFVYIVFTLLFPLSLNFKLSILVSFSSILVGAWLYKRKQI